MNILVISNYSGPITPSRPEASIFLGLRKKGVNVWIMTPRKGPFIDQFEKAGINIVDYRATKKIDWKAIKLIRKTVKENNIQIIQAFNSKAISNSSFAIQGLNCKLVAYRGYTGNIRWYDLGLYLTHLNPRIDYTICLAESVSEVFLKNGFPKHKPVTINKGHNPEWYADIKTGDLSEFNIPEGAMVCSFVANNRVKMKGIEYLVKSANYLPDDAKIYFLMVGRGIDSEPIPTLLNQSKHKDKFIFAGYRENATELVKACDISISVSQFGEATQKAMIEAMFLGNPVIISNISGNRGMAIDGEGGYIVEPGNDQQIAKALMKFYNNRDQIPAMGEAAKAHITQFLNAEKTIEEYFDFYQRILA